MIVQKIQNENGAFVPDIPEGLEYKSATYRPETDDYLITFSPEQIEANRITPSQGMTQLSRDNKLADIENYISNAQDAELTIFWERAVFWDKNSAIVKSLANAFNIDLEVFWQAAKQIEV